MSCLAAGELRPGLRPQRSQDPHSCDCTAGASSLQLTIGKLTSEVLAYSSMEPFMTEIATPEGHNNYFARLILTEPVATAAANAAISGEPDASTDSAGVGVADHSSQSRLGGTWPSPHKRLIFVLVLIALCMTHSAPQSWNDLSRMGTLQALVESGSFVIDKTEFAGTGDKVFIGGHFYSDKPPVPSVLGAAVYFPLHHLGFRLINGPTFAYYLITLLTVTLFWLFGTLAFFHSLSFTGLDPERRLLASLALGFGSLYFTWSQTLNSHGMAAGSLAIGFYFLLRARYEGHVNRNLAVAGLFLSLAATADMPTGIYYAAFGLYIARDPLLRRAAIFYVAPLLATLVPSLAIDYSIHHSVLPVQIFRTYFQYAGSPWVGSGQLSGTHANDLDFFRTYAVRSLVGPRGFLLYNPLLVIAIWGIGRTIWRKGPFFYEAVTIAAASTVMLLYYWTYTNNYGGWSYSIRWFVPMLPLLFFFLCPYFEAFDPRRRRWFQALLCASVVIAAVGAANPWSPVGDTDVPLIVNSKIFLTNLGW